MATAQNSVVGRLLKDPLVHFLIGGLAIFIFITANQQQQSFEDDPYHIVVDRDILLKQLQYMTKTFEPKQAEHKLDNMSPEQLQKLIKQYVSEEAFYRESEALGFGEDDYIIKNRMIEKMDFIVKGGSASDFEVSEEEIQQYYDANKAKFIEPGVVTFTHSFVKQQANETAQQASKRIKDIAAQLQQDNAEFTDSIKYGDRFPLHLNYVEKNYEEVAAHFGAQFTDKVFALSPNETQWHGPFVSSMGHHMVLLTKNVDDAQLTLDEVKGSIIGELQRVKQMEARDKAIEQLIESYNVDIKQPLTQKGGK